MCYSSHSFDNNISKTRNIKINRKCLVRKVCNQVEENHSEKSCKKDLNKVGNNSHFSLFDNRIGGAYHNKSVCCELDQKKNPKNGQFTIMEIW